MAGFLDGQPGILRTVVARLERYGARGFLDLRTDGRCYGLGRLSNCPQRQTLAGPNNSGGHDAGHSHTRWTRHEITWKNLDVCRSGDPADCRRRLVDLRS